MTEKQQKDKRCMYEIDGVSCTNSSYGGARGLCMTHYVGYRYHVQKGNKTWKEFEDAGKCKKKMTQTEKNTNQMHPHKTYNQKNPKYDF